MPSADATALHALAQQCSGAIAAHFVRIGEGGLDVADVAGARAATAADVGCDFAHTTRRTSRLSIHGWIHSDRSKTSDAWRREHAGWTSAPPGGQP